MATTGTASLGSMVTNRRRELVLVGLVLSALFTLVSMVGWRASDPTLLRPGSGAIENPCGWVGANLSDFVFAGVGFGSWVLVLLVPIAILRIAGRNVLSLPQWISAFALYIVSLAGLHLAFRPLEPHPAGGALGASLGELLELLVGTVGAWLVLGSFALLLLTALARIRWSAVASTAVSRVERLLPVLGRALRSGLAAGYGSLRWAWRRVGAGLVGLVSWFAAGFMGAGSRIWTSFRSERVEAPPSDEGFDEVDAESWHDAVLSDVSDPVRQGDTVVGVGRALVQVEWEPTAGASAEDVLELFPEFEPRSAPSGAGQATPASVGRRSAVAAVAEPEVTRPSVSAHAPSERDLEPDLDPKPAGKAPVSVGPRRSPIPSSTGGGSSAARPAAPSTGEGCASPNGPGVAVHKNELLELRSADDGSAVRAQATFQLPRLSLLDEVPAQESGYDEQELQALAATLEEKLQSFNVKGSVTGVRPGPVVTIFEFLPDPGIKVSRISGLSDDLAMALKALSVRIVAPIPGRGVVGIEIPSKRRLTVHLRDVLASSAFRETDAVLPCVLGKDVEGRPVVADLSRMPHLLIGGTTGSGKSVGVNGMLMSLLFTLGPDELRLLLIDPKMLEFELYSDIPHLLHPVVTDARIATQALAWACREMDERYALLARWGTRNIVGYNKKVERELKSWTREKARRYAPRDWTDDDDLPMPEKLPLIVIVVDELADLMMVAGKEVEDSICRVAQKARACGIHLIVATQRPSVDVVTGLIKANLPTRIAFQLRSRHDSRTVLDEIGAENLLGKGDMLFMPPGVGGVQRCHGAFVSDEEVARVTTFLREQAEPDFIDSLEESGEGGGVFGDEEQDELYDDAVEIIIQSGKASTSMIQRHLKIGYNRAARIVDMMEANGVVGPSDGSRPREVLVGGGA